MLSKLPLRENSLRTAPPQHATAEWARRKLGDEHYFALTSFAVVRHPYDRAISYYQFISQQDGHHRHELVKQMSFEDYLDDLASRPRRKRQTQTDFLVDGRGSTIVSRILRFESLGAEIEALWGELGLPGHAAIPHRNASTRRANEDYLSPQARDLIFELYRDDFVRLGYER